MNDKWINKDHLKLMSDGDGDFEKELLNLFKEDSQERVNNIESAIGSNNKDVLIVELHTLKGASANVGASQIEEISTKMEIMAKSEEFQELAALFPSLKEHLKNTITQINNEY